MPSYKTHSIHRQADENTLLHAISGFIGVSVYEYLKEKKQTDEFVRSLKK